MTTSLRNLERFFANTFNTTPTYWARRLRCRIARQLITEGWKNTAVVTELNFGNESHLCHEFQKFYGVSPQTFAPVHRAKFPQPASTRTLRRATFVSALKHCCAMVKSQSDPKIAQTQHEQCQVHSDPAVFAEPVEGLERSRKLESFLRWVLEAHLQCGQMSRPERGRGPRCGAGNRHCGIEEDPGISADHGRICALSKFSHCQCVSSGVSGVNGRVCEPGRSRHRGEA